MTQKDWIGVMGGATRFTEEQLIAAYEVGREIARRGKHLVTGGTNGIPYAAAMGAKQEGALVVGISPASSFEEHVVRYKKPLDYADLIVYTGMGVDGRSAIIVRSVAGAVFIGGEFGTLNEFTAAWMAGRNVLGIMEGLGGISGRFKELLSSVQTSWGSEVIYAADPTELAQEVCTKVDQIFSGRESKVSLNGIGQDVRDTIQQYLAETAVQLLCNSPLMPKSPYDQ